MEIYREIVLPVWNPKISWSKILIYVRSFELDGDLFIWQICHQPGVECDVQHQGGGFFVLIYEETAPLEEILGHHVKIVFLAQLIPTPLPLSCIRRFVSRGPCGVGVR